MGIPDENRTYTPKEYFAIADNAEFHCEFNNGQVVAMAGGSIQHAAVSANTIAAINSGLGNKNCFVTTSDARLHIHAANSYVHPDAMVICGPPHYLKGRTDTISNPTLVVEVLSPSTAGYDRGEKFMKYRSLPTLKYYLLIEPDRPHIDLYTKNFEGLWVLESFSDLDATLTLSGLQLKFAMRDIYKQSKYPPGKPL